MWRQWRDVLGILIGGAVVCMLLDALAFHTRYYTRVLDPHTSTGSLELTLSIEAHRQYWAKGVLVLGDSIMQQGFSTRVANYMQVARGYQFSNAAIPGTRERCWYYLLRDLDPDRTRYSVVVIPTESYDDRDLHDEDPAEQIYDLHYLAARLRLSDALEFASSFRSMNRRLEALRGIVLKGTIYRQDVQVFLDHPRQRIADVRSYRKMADWDSHNYDGLGHSLSIEDKQAMEAAFLEPVPPQRGYLAEYRRRWLRPIVERYRGTATRILLIRPPMNAIARRDVPPPTGHSIVRELASRPGVALLDEHAFDELERPEYFYDPHHLNAAGRAQFTPMLVRLFAQTIGAR